VEKLIGKDWKETAFRPQFLFRYRRKGQGHLGRSVRRWRHKNHFEIQRNRPQRPNPK